MKVCGRCRKKKPLSDFGKNRAKRDGLQTQCKSCRKETAQEWYARNGDHHRETARQLQAKRTEEKRSWLLCYLKAHPCADCGETDPLVLEFDHVDDDKEGTISRFRRGRYPLSQMQREVEKCEVVCANCHRRRTALRAGNWWKDPEAQ